MTKLGIGILYIERGTSLCPCIYLLRAYAFVILHACTVNLKLVVHSPLDTDTYIHVVIDNIASENYHLHQPISIWYLILIMESDILKI